MPTKQWMVPSLALAAWLVCASLATAQGVADRPPAEKPVANPAIDPKGERMQDILAKWARQSTKLASLDLAIRRRDISDKWGTEEYEGRAMFKAPNLAWLDFNKVVVPKGDDPKAQARKLVHHERIICTGKDVWQYRTKEHQIFIHELGKEQQQRALQEGPLPFLFNFSADNARKRYRMVLTREDATSYVILVLPLMNIDRECFSQALIQLDREYLLPTRIVLFDPEGRDRKDFMLSKIKPNVKVADENFQGKRLGPPWKILVNKEGDAAAKQVGREAARGGGAGAQAAPRRGTQGPLR
jgi:outer membrane lipoprotein-sorting protein